MAFWNKRKEEKEEEDLAVAADNMRRWYELTAKAAMQKAEMERKMKEREAYYKTHPPIYTSSVYHAGTFCGVTMEAVFAIKGLFAELGLEPTVANVEVLKEFIKEAKV